MNPINIKNQSQQAQGSNHFNPRAFWNHAKATWNPKLQVPDGQHAIVAHNSGEETHHAPGEHQITWAAQVTLHSAEDCPSCKKLEDAIREVSEQGSGSE
jgi:uncharacterized protein involved in type VI secretion and phage assembly